MPLLDELKRQVKESSDAVDSVLILIHGLNDRLKAAEENLAAGGNDTSELAAFIADLERQENALAAAVVANTPVAPAPAEPLPSPEEPA